MFVNGCPNDIEVSGYLNDQPVIVTWLPPFAVRSHDTPFVDAFPPSRAQTDNSGQIPTIVSTSNPGDTFPQGTTAILVEAIDGIVTQGV